VNGSITISGISFAWQKKKKFSQHERIMLIMHYKGWGMAVLICEDLRFPVWSR
jgi:predicted amidohydrolase